MSVPYIYTGHLVRPILRIEKRVCGYCRSTLAEQVSWVPIIPGLSRGSNYPTRRAIDSALEWILSRSVLQDPVLSVPGTIVYGNDPRCKCPNLREELRSGGRDLLIFDGSPSARLKPVVWIEVSFPRYWVTVRKATLTVRTPTVASGG